jgi:hypothetical protein
MSEENGVLHLDRFFLAGKSKQEKEDLIDKYKKEYHVNDVKLIPSVNSDVKGE